MNTRIIGMSILCAFSAISSLLAADAETIAYFPLDADAKSIVNADRNPSSVTTLLEPGYASHEIAYDESVKGVTICDKSSLLRESNAGCLKLAWARMSIDLDRFPLSNDVDAVTIEMFVKGSGLSNYFPFFVLAPFNNTTGLGSNNPLQTPQVNVVPYDNGAIFAYIHADGVPSQQIFGNGNLLDDQWHHVAMVFQPNDKGGTTATWYRDYNKVLSIDQASKWTGSAGLKDDSLKLVLGSRRGTIYLDEIRITKGVLPSANWMRQHASPAPVNGETLLYFPFDEDVGTIVHADECADASWTGATAVFTDNVGSRKALRTGDKTFVRKPNLASLLCDKTRYYYAPSYWAFTSNQCQSATIEFFYRGDDPSQVASSSPMFRLGNDVTSLRIVLSAYSDEKAGMDHRAFLAVRDRTNKNSDGHATSVVCGKDGIMCDGRWHHVAMTAETVEEGTKGLVKFYLDYEKVHEVTLAEPWCAITPGLSGDLFNIGSPSCVCSIDELRISKGALPPEKFLRKFSTDGLMLIFR